MISTVSDETVHARPWGVSLAVAGAMAAGMAAGRRNKLALVAGIAAVAGIKWMLRRNVTEPSSPLAASTRLKIQQQVESSKTGLTECCVGLEQNLELHLGAEVHEIVVVPAVENYVADDEVPEVWEQRRDEPVYHDAVPAHTVWFEMPDLVEAVPAMPARTEVHQLTGAFFSENPILGLDPLPKVTSLDEDFASDMTSVYHVKTSSSAASALPFFDLQPFTSDNAKLPESELVSPAEAKQIMDELHRGPHRSVVPHAPVDDRRSGRWMKLAAMVALVIAVILLVLVTLQPDGRAQSLKHHVQVAGRSESGSPVNDRGDWATPLLREK
ncbi:MAG: hypothetical protein K8R87_06615 [Verrucomicrobia bacterium]|nr:hypothetical protein [Verrucomicrobiota bacterium]